MSAMLRLRVQLPSTHTERVVDRLRDDPAVSSLTVLPGCSVKPPGDLIIAELAREGTNSIVDFLRREQIPQLGSIQLDPVRSWLSAEGVRAEKRSPGSGADAVVWNDVTQQAYEESELNFSFVSFMFLATLIAGIAIVLDSQVLVIGAMVLGPEFAPISAMALAVVRRRRSLFRQAARTLAVGFLIAILGTMLITLLGRALGWVTLEDMTGPRPSTAFIYSPDRWSFVVAVIAAIAGVLSLTSARVGGLSGVFISVTTIPAGANLAMALAFGVRDEAVGSAAQLAVNFTGMVIAGALTLWVQQWVWRRLHRESREQQGQIPTA